MESSRADLQEKIKAQGDIVRKLKSEKVEKSLVRNNNEIFLYKIFHHFQNNLNSILIKFVSSNCHRKKENDSFTICRIFHHWWATLKTSMII